MTATDEMPAPEGHPTRAQARAWSDAETNRLISLWSVGTPNEEIARIMSRTSQSVSMRAVRLKLPRKTLVLAGAAAGGRFRPCLTCRREFLSSGPGNRMCDLCRASGDETGGDYVVAFPDNR